MTKPLRTVEERKAFNRERTRKFRENNPNYMKEWRAKEDEAQRWLKQRHLGEFAEFYMANREQGMGRHKARDRALSALAKAHPEEWKQMLKEAR